MSTSGVVAATGAVTVLGVGSGGSGTSLQDAQSNLLATATAQVADWNQKLKVAYNVTYSNYVLRMQSGGVVSPADQQVPQPPMGYVLSPPDVNGFVFPMIGTTPVCAPGAAMTYLGGLTIPARDPNHIAVGNLINGDWFQVGPLDGTPNGFVTPRNVTSADGVTGSFQKYGAPVGAGWYLLVG